MRLKSIINIANRKIINIKMRPCYKKLKKLKYYQFDKFNLISKKFSEIYYKLNSYNISNFTTTLWEDYNKLLEKIFLPDPPFSFLRIPVIKNTMFVIARGKWMKQELDFLEKQINDEKLKSLLEEDYCGDPILSSSKYITSHNSIHHLYHLIRFSKQVDLDLSRVNDIIEWGGGYGNTAKIFIRLNNDITYTIIDTPLFSCIQWLYLATILGEENINFISEPKQCIQSNKINILPLCFLKNHNLNSDLFIATWSLSESSVYSQDFVVLHNFFDSKHMLMAYQDSSEKLPDANRIGKIAKKMGAVIERIDFLPGSGNYYIFK